MKNTVCIMLAYLIFSFAFPIESCQTEQDPRFVKLMTVLVEHEAWSIRPILKELNSDQPINWSNFENFNVNGKRWVNEYSMTGASIVRAFEPLETHEKFWAWILVMAMNEELSLENFSALLDYKKFGKIPEKVIAGGFQLFCGNCPLFGLLAERKFITEDILRRNAHFLPLRCEIPDFEKTIEACGNSDKNFPYDMSSFELRKFYNKNSSNPEKLLSVVGGAPIVFWELEQLSKDRTLAFFEVLYATYDGTLFEDKTLWERIYLSDNKELISFILQQPSPKFKRWLLLLNEHITPEQNMPVGYNEQGSLWGQYFMENRMHMEQELLDAQTIFAVNFARLIKQSPDSSKMLIEMVPAGFFKRMPHNNGHPLTIALQHNIPVFKALVAEKLQINDPMLAEHLLRIGQEKGELAFIVENIPTEVLKKINDMPLKEQIIALFPALRASLQDL